MNQNIIITGMRIGKYSVPVPAGLSELVNSANAWTTEPPTPLEGYNREVIRRNGKIVTRLTKI